MKGIILNLAAVAAVCVALASCAGTEKTEAVTAEIEAAQMEGRNMARSVIKNQWKDSVQLSLGLDEARARKQEMIDSGYPDRAAAFDSTFTSTVRTVRPDLKTWTKL